MSNVVDKNANHRALQRTERALQDSRSTIEQTYAALQAGHNWKAEQLLLKYAKEAGLKL